MSQPNLSARPTKLLQMAAVGLIIGTMASRAADFEVTADEFASAYTFAGSPPKDDPALTLVRGRTYTFLIQADSSHPFFIYPEAGVVNNNTFDGTITYKVPTNAPNNTITYFCSIHGFGNQISFVDPPAAPSGPPVTKIVGLTLGSNVVVTSTGTNTWTPLLEYSTNLTTTNWYAMTIQSNRFANGTNETFCGRPPGESVFFRIRSQLNP